jgi:predicted acylesterase/phospholipase RssA
VALLANAPIPGVHVALSVSDHPGHAKTAFVFAGGGSFGAIQVGMMHSLAAHGISADMVVGSSVGALNGAFYAGDPTLKGVLQLETIWRGLRRQDVFPITWRTLLGFIWRRDFLITHDGIRKLIDDYIPYRNLQDAKIPVHIVTTDIVSGDSVVLSEGPTSEAIVASTAIPGAFAPIHYKDFYLSDGAISSCRRCVRWWDRLTTSRARRIILSVRSRAPMRGWRKADWSRAAFRMKYVRTVTETLRDSVELRCTAKSQHMVDGLIPGGGIR